MNGTTEPAARPQHEIALSAAPRPDGYYKLRGRDAGTGDWRVLVYGPRDELERLVSGLVATGHYVLITDADA